jgi:diacylglycerol kinase family enzyme
VNKPFQKKGPSTHFGILVNRRATNYERGAVSRLIELIRKQNDYYTIAEPDSAMDLFKRAEMLGGVRRTRHRKTPDEQRRGVISALIAAGGDGTVNLVARAALESGIPLGILPLGRVNNIAASLYESTKPEKCISKVLEKKQKRIDYASVANQKFFGSIGLGLIPSLEKILSHNGRPRFGFGWNSVGAKAATSCTIRNSIIKVDAFRFELSPLILNINLLPYSAGIKFSPVSGQSDGLAEVIFDVNIKPREVGGILKQLNQGKFVYGEEVRLFRGKNITIQPTSGMTLYLDGELLELPTDIIKVEVGSKNLVCYA